MTEQPPHLRNLRARHAALDALIGSAVSQARAAQAQAANWQAILDMTPVHADEARAIAQRGLDRARERYDEARLTLVSLRRARASRPARPAKQDA